MLDTVQIIFGGMDGSEPVRAEVRAWLLKLAPLIEQAGVTGGHVLIDATYQHHHGAGWRYQATLEMTVPAGVMAIPAECSGNNGSDDIYVAVRNVFRCLRRTLAAAGTGAAASAGTGAGTGMPAGPTAGSGADRGRQSVTLPADLVAPAPLVPVVGL